MSLHTSFLRVIMHHGALQAGYSQLPLVNEPLIALQTPPVASVVLMRVPEATCTGEATGDD